MKWRDWRLATYLAAAGLVWSAGIGVLLYFLPLGTSVSASSTGASVESKERLFTLSFADLWPLIVPALLCALATWAAARRHRWLLVATTILLAAFAILGGFSIGLAYVPAVMLLVVSVFASSRARRAAGDGDSDSETR